MKESDSLIKITNYMNPFALETAMGYRNISQTKLCKEIEGLSQPNLSKFLKGYFAVISEDKLKAIMQFLDFPFDFLYKDIKSIKFFYSLQNK